jgi:hypothetical protein
MTAKLGARFGFGCFGAAALGFCTFAFGSGLLDFSGCGDVGAGGAQAFGVAFSALVLCSAGFFGCRRRAHACGSKRWIDLDEEVTLLHAISDASEHASHLARRACREPRLLERTNVTEEGPLGFDAAVAHLGNSDARGRRPVGSALRRRLAFAAEGSEQ